MMRLSRNVCIYISVAVTGLLLAFTGKPVEEQNFNLAFKTYFSRHTDSVTSSILRLYQVVERKNFNIDSAKIALVRVRNEYKSIEAFVIYFFPGDARILNRAIVPEMEEDDEKTPYVIPHGFQYIELLMYSDSVDFLRRKIKDEVDEVYVLVSKFNELISYMDFKETDVFEAMQMQLIRQFMLGFANFETGDSRMGIPESSTVLASIEELMIEAYPQPDTKHADILNQLYKDIRNARKNLSTVKPGAEPDYLSFYTNHYIPVSGSLSIAREMMISDNSYDTKAVNYNIRSVFDPHAFNTFFFLPAKKLASRNEVIELGRTLFFDPALSANNLRACASCHQPGKSFTDGLPLSQAFVAGQFLKRNAPTIINSVLQRKLFHDGRAFTFEDQAGSVMSNPLEMHNDFSQVAGKLRKSPEYVGWFRKAFAGSEDTIITNKSVLTAVAEYERSLVGMNSRFDKTVSGRENLLNADEHEGFNIFMGKGNCASCHFIPLFNGLMPPEYVETEWEILGVPSSKVTRKREMDMDPGRAAVIDDPIFRHAFKTPTIRNIELTAPYMHNGVFKTLEEVIEFYDAGGGTALGYEVPQQTLPEDSLHLTATEKFQLIAFMKSLTDTITLTTKPLRLPEFTGEEVQLNSRPIGGEY